MAEGTESQVPTDSKRWKVSSVVSGSGAGASIAWAATVATSARLSALVQFGAGEGPGIAPTLSKGGPVLHQVPAPQQQESSTARAVANVMARYGATPGPAPAPILPSFFKRWKNWRRRGSWCCPGSEP